MTTTANTLLPAPDPAPPSVASFNVDPDTIRHPALREATQAVIKLRDAYLAALSRYALLCEPARETEAAHADAAAATAAVEAGGEYIDPGTPAADKLLADRQAAHRELIPRREAFSVARHQWRTNLRRNRDLYTIEYAEERADAINQARALLGKVAKLGVAIDHASAIIEWIDQPEHERSPADSTGLRGLRPMPRMGRPGPISQGVADILAALDQPPATAP